MGVHLISKEKLAEIEKDKFHMEFGIESETDLQSLPTESTNYQGRGYPAPCYRKSDGEIGMYDVISNEFLTNSGTGEF